MQAAAASSQLASGAALLPGNSIESPGGAYQLTMRATGNLVETGPAGQVWATGTTSPGAYLLNQPAGNLVLISSAVKLIWTSGTDGKGPANLTIGTDGRVADYRGSTPIWSISPTPTIPGITPTPDSTPTAAPTPSPSPTTGTGAAPPSAAAVKAIAFARAQIGKPYKYGGTGPASYDCSGLVQAAYAAAGVSIPRTSQQQYKQGQVVAAGAHQPGDLVFYNSATAPSHVALYLGSNQIIESLKPGTFIRVDAVTYPGHPVGYRRYATPAPDAPG